MCPLADYYIAIQLNTLQVGYVHLQIISIAIQLNTLQVGCVHLQIIVWFRFNGLVDNHPTNLL